MRYSWDKARKSHAKKEYSAHRSHQIRSLKVDEFHKYLGMEEKRWWKHQQGHERKCKKRIISTNKENIDNPSQRKEETHGH